MRKPGWYHENQDWRQGIFKISNCGNLSARGAIKLYFGGYERC